MFTTIIYDVLVILSAGLIAGLVCRRAGISVLVGYLVIGVLIGKSTLGLIGDKHHEIEHIAEAGVFFLLFSIGLEFSLEELIGLGRNFFVGGGAQMLLVAVPIALALVGLGVAGEVALLLGAACAFSSTVLLFKALSEWGQIGVPHGRRAIGILLFQDAALIPILLVLPLITGTGEPPGLGDYAFLLFKSLVFIASVVFIRRLLSRRFIPLLAGYRSPDLIVLLALVTLGGMTLAASSVGLPPAIGAFAAGLVFSGNRWTHQVDALIFPFRESFAAIFFISLGLIANPTLLWREPLLFFGGLVGIILLKAVTAMLAFRLTGLSWRVASGMGFALAHIGEFAFVLVLLGRDAGALTDLQYERFVTISLASLILSPMLIWSALQWTQSSTSLLIDSLPRDQPADVGGQAIVIGAGPTGRQVASRLEIAGYDVCVVDVSPVNLVSFSQQGFRTVAGDASRREVLERAQLVRARIVIVCIAEDESSMRISRLIRKLNPRCMLVVRCRYHANVAQLYRLGVQVVVSEEFEASEVLMRVIDDRIATSDTGRE